jgi:hypothetical protein
VFHDGESGERWKRHLPIQVQSCWNGIAILDPEPFYTPPHTRFRMARIAEGECSASECSLICNDYWASGYGRIMMVPRVKLAYDHKVYDIIHPERRNLSRIRQYQRLGGVEEKDMPGSDPQDRAWFGPHDRLFVEEEGRGLEFVGGPEYGESPFLVSFIFVVFSRRPCTLHHPPTPSYPTPPLPFSAFGGGTMTRPASSAGGANGVQRPSSSSRILPLVLFLPFPSSSFLVFYPFVHLLP